MIAVSIFREGSRPSGKPKAEATGLAPEKSAQPDPPALSQVREGSLRCAAPISWVKSRSGGLGYLNALIARRAFQMPLPFRLQQLGERGGQTAKLDGK